MKNIIIKSIKGNDRLLKEIRLAEMLKRELVVYFYCVIAVMWLLSVLGCPQGALIESVDRV